MSSVRCLLLPVLVLVLILRPAELRGLRSELEAQRSEDAGEAATKASVSSERSPFERVARGAKGGGSRRREPPSRDDDPGGYFTTPRAARHTAVPPGNGSSTSRSPGLLNPLFPVTDGSYLAYTVMLLALVLFAAGIVGNLALMCIVWHSFYLKSAWNCVLAGLAFWDFLVLFFCLPVVVFHELTLTRLLGDLSCRLVPYLEVTSLGVATFSLCALSIDRFHAATGPGPHQSPKVEPCQSILSKLAVIFVGSMVLAAPELLLWQLLQETVSLPALPTELQQNQASGSLMAAFRARTDAFKVDVCVREPSAELPESVYSLVLTYHEARMWWFFGCYLCLPLLFTLACDLVTRHVLAQRLPASSEKVTVRCSSTSSSSSTSMKKKQHVRQQRLRSTVMALTLLYVACNLPESVCNITLAYISVPVSAALPPLTLPALGLIGQFLLFVRCSATPVLLLCLCRSLGQAFMDCCCCCCEECLPDGNSSSSSASTAATSTLSSPTSPSPSSLSPSGKEETVKSVLTEVAAFDRAKDSRAAIGTPC